VELPLERGTDAAFEHCDDVFAVFVGTTTAKRETEQDGRAGPRAGDPSERMIH